MKRLKMIERYTQTLIDSGLKEFEGAITAFTNWKQEIINSFSNEHANYEDDENITIRMVILKG